MTAAEFGDPRLPARFWAKVAVNEETGCWEWTAGRCGSGYGTFLHEGRTHRSHRVAYAAMVGALPAFVPGGLQLDHLCRNRGCVNPAHLELVTPQTNTLRGNSPAAGQSRRTHCPSGHELSGANLQAASARRGERCCALCARGRAAAQSSAIIAARRSLGLTKRDYADMFGFSRATATAVLADIDAGTAPSAILAGARATKAFA